MILYIQVSQVEFLFRGMSNSFFRRWWNGFGGFWMIFFRTIYSAQNLKKNFQKLMMFSDFFFKFSHFFAFAKNKNAKAIFYFAKAIFFNVRKLMSLIARVLQLIDFQTITVQWQAKMPCHWCHFSNRVTSVTCEKQAYCTGKCWYLTVYGIRAMSAMGLRK